MANITVVFIDDTKKEYIDNGAPGGSYEQAIRYEGDFVIITNAHGSEHAIPSSRIKEVVVHNTRRSF